MFCPKENRHYLRPKNRGIKLHLGCGDFWWDGYLNIDIGIYGGTDMFWDLKKPLPFTNKSVEVIELYDVLEHFTRDEARELLREFKRLLIEGGGVRLSVPDLEKEISFPFTDRVLTNIYGIASYDSHKWGYDKTSLQKLFEEAGFKNITIASGELEERPGEIKLILEAQT